MAKRSSTNTTPRDNASLAALFSMDFFPAEGGLGDTINEFRTAQRIVEHSGITAMVDEWQTHDRAGRKPGPTPWLSEVQVITLMLVLTLSRRSALFTEMRRLLREASAESLAVLDITVPEGLSDSALYHRAYNSYRRLVRLMDPEPGSLYRTLTKVQLAARRAARDSEVSRTHRARAHDFGNALLWGTWMLLPRKVRREFKGDIAVDATVIKAPAPGRSHTSPWASSDPEAGWYKRDGDHNGEATSRAATKYQRRSSVVLWARELHTAVTYGKGVPVVMLSATLAVPGHDLAENALGCVDAVLSRGISPGHFVSDRAYLPGKKPMDLALPLRKRGYSLVFDYNRTQASLGQSSSHKGAIMVEGRWYCPDMPEPLVSATIDYFLREANDPERISTQAYEERIKRRERYMLRPKERPDSEGNARYQHPKGYRHRSRGRALPQVCEQATITIPPDAGAKCEQAYPYRSPKWQDHYSSGRQSVESMNKSIKDGKFMPVDDAEMRPRRGWINQLLSVVVMVAATNVRKIIDWLNGQVGLTRIASAPLRRARRREVTRGWSVVPNAPPAVAVGT